jgi:hypothetical protein
MIDYFQLVLPMLTTTITAFADATSQAATANAANFPMGCRCSCCPYKLPLLLLLPLIWAAAAPAAPTSCH